MRRCSPLPPPSALSILRTAASSASSAILGGQAEPLARTEHAAGERAELGRDRVGVPSKIDERLGTAIRRASWLPCERARAAPIRRAASARAATHRQARRAVRDRPHRVAIVGIEGGPGRLVEAGVRIERALNLGTIDASRTIAKSSSGNSVVHENKKSVSSAWPSRRSASPARVSAAHTARRSDDDRRRRAPSAASRRRAAARDRLGGDPHAVEQADERAQPCDPEAAVATPPVSGSISRASSEASIEASAREFQAHGVGIGGEREHRGQRIVGEQLAIEIAQKAHRVAANQSGRRR